VYCRSEIIRAWPQEGGVYAWVKEAFGIKTGYLLIMVVGTFIWMVPYFLFRWFRRPGWKTDPED